MEFVKVAVAARPPRGNKNTRSHFNSHQNHHPRFCLNLITPSIIVAIVIPLLGAGRLIKHQPAIQESNISFIPPLFDSKQAESQHDACATYLLLSLLTSLTSFPFRISTAFIRVLGGDQSLFKILTPLHLGLLWTQDWATSRKITSVRTAISGLSYLAIGLIVFDSFRKGQINPEESDLCQHIQQLHQTFNTSKLFLLLALLINPLSSNQTTVLNQIANYFVLDAKIEETIKMDDLRKPDPGIYRPERDRMLREEVMAFKDVEAARKKAQLLKFDREDALNRRETGLYRKEADSSAADEEDSPTNRVARLDRPSVAWAPDPIIEPRRLFTESTLSRRNHEADGRGAFANMPNTLPSPNVSPSVSYIRSAIRKTKSSLFDKRPSQEDGDIPAIPRQSFVSRAASSLFISSVDRREHAQAAGGRSFSTPQTQGPTNVTRIRDLEMEEAARQMGFVIDPNRFGLPQVLVGGDEVMSTQDQEVASLSAGTLSDSSASDDEHDYTDEEDFMSRDDDTDVITGHQAQLPNKPSRAARNPVLMTHDRLDDTEDDQPDSMAWLTSGFSPCNLDLLKDFGTPPRAQAHSSQSSPTSSVNNGVPDCADSPAAFDSEYKRRGDQQMPAKTGSSSNSMNSSGKDSNRKQAQHKNSRPQEGGILKGLRGTTEPSLVAWEQLRARSLMEANTDRRDPNIAAKMKISSKQLPPEAPRPASKEPVPKARRGMTSVVRRQGSIDNIKRRDTKISDSSGERTYTPENASIYSQSSQYKNGSLVSISEVSGRGYKSPAEASARSFGSSPGVLIHEDQANINKGATDRFQMAKPPSRSPPPLPSHPTHQYFARNEFQEEQLDRAEDLATPLRPNKNNPLPESGSKEVKQDGGGKGKKWSYKRMFKKEKL